MNCKDLMIGDWVFSAKLQKVFKVMGIENDHDEIKSVGCHIPMRILEPIPLTEEMLKANGFDIVQDGDALTIWKQEDDEYENEVYDITIYAFKGIIGFDTSIRHHGAIRKNIYYVHEFQHALRLCGLNEIADNFKV